MNGDQRNEGLVIVRGAVDGFVQEVIAGAHQLRSDEPTSAGGTDTGPTPDRHRTTFFRVRWVVARQ